jgi:2-polyprenyl-3-methyl-5-hydroxy-6-metoxy-1,4-benzoquinol methylase
MSEIPAVKEWGEHKGPIAASENGFDVIDCEQCGFRHIVPLPATEDLKETYEHDYYSQEKPLYIDRHREDLEWWDMVYGERYDILEKALPAHQRRMLDIGSGPGFFLLNGHRRGWQVKGIEPSRQACEHSRNVLNLDVDNDFFSDSTATGLGRFDAVHMSEVLEHIPDPAMLLTLVHGLLNEGGMLCINVPNDFNPFQKALSAHLGFKPWWVAPPHHVNYFDFESLQKLVERCGFEVVHKEATFPIDMFLLMGDNYVGNDPVGRDCHKKRKAFEHALAVAGLTTLKRDLYTALAGLGLGREITLFARKRDGAGNMLRGAE